MPVLLKRPRFLGLRCAATVAALLLAASARLEGQEAGAKSAHPIVAGFERFHAAEAGSVKGGQLLLTELNCVSCHQAETSAGRKPAPVLDGVGTRVQRGYLRKFLADPHAVKPGTTMPKPLPTDPERDAKIEALAHFLASTGTLKQERPDRKHLAPGRDLYHKIGCVACHGSRDAAGNPDKVLPTSVPLGDLKAKYSIPSLKLFLENPHATRPGGRMPGLLKGKEATEVANYLLQGIAYAAVPTGANLSYSYYEGAWDRLPDFGKLKPVDTGKAADFDISIARRANNMALRFEGYLHIEAAGAYTFYLNSDDGSKLWIDDKLIVDNDGIHAPAMKTNRVELYKGKHKLVVAVFNGGGGAELSLEMEGRGIGRQSAANFIFLTPEGNPKPAPAPAQAAKDDGNFEVRPELVTKGQAVFVAAGCVSCHQMQAIKGQPANPPPSLAKLRPEGGCLAPTPQKGVPWYGLSAPQRSALAAAIRAKPGAEKPAPAEVVARTLTTFNCYACHERDKVGGIEEGVNAFFTTTEKEMGEEGRVPPSLNGVGAKLNPAYLKKVLDQGADDRPYMHTRMPKFGDGNVGHLVGLFGQLDPAEPVAAVKFTHPTAKVKAEARLMVGVKAFGCINCHTFAGNKSQGIQGIDMTLMPQRLKHDWFRAYVINPQKYRPGTRMPSSWPEGNSLLPHVLDGRADTQVEAIWAYLSDGPRALLPLGMHKQSIVLAPEKDAIIYRNFIEGAGARAIGVGYPEKASLAFDANDLRLAMLWQGAFMDARRHWTDRGVGYEPPLGDNILHLPPGPGFAVLGSGQEAWPSKSAKDLGQRFNGYRLSKDQRPTFLYTVQGVRVEDHPDVVAGKAAPALRRTLELKADQAPENLYFRAAVGEKIEPMGDGWFRVNGEWKLRIEAAAEPQVRQAGGKTELIVPVRFQGNGAKIVQEFVW